MSTYRDLWNSGRLMREAAQCRTVAELAQRLGVSEEGLKRAVYTLRQAGEPVPQFRDMLAKGGPREVEDFDPPTIRSTEEPPFRYGEAGGDGEWEEKTSPGVDIGGAGAGIEGSIHEGEAALNVRADSSPIHMEQDVPAGHRVKGLSTFYDATGKVVAQWVKTDRRAEDRLAALMTALASLAEPFRGLHEPIAPATEFDDDLISIYAIGDPHIGMQAWAEECGEDFDVKIAERDLVGAIDHLVDMSPPSGTAIVALLGDTFHVDGKSNATTAGTPQDVDTRWSKVFGIVVRTARRKIERALMKHKRVIGQVIPGNHDEHMALALSYSLQAYFERDERVTIDMSPSPFRWFRFGDCFFGFNHGHNVKLEALPGIMACDRPHDWGETVYRKIFIGHVHHRQVKELPGCLVQSYGTLASKDAYHNGHGYRSMQEMRCEVFHRKWGPIAEYSAGIAQIRSRNRAA